MVHKQLAKIINSTGFIDSPRLQQFLTYIVGEALAGRAERIKGYSIAHDVFERDDPDDAQLSGIVRVEAGRLRRRLTDYYAAEGARDSLRISMPKGAYIPLFESPISTDGPEESTDPVSRQRRNRYRPLRTPLAAFVILLVAGALWLVSNPFERTDEDKPEPARFESRPFIAVLPFSHSVNVDADIAAGLTEDILTDLVQLPEIDVAALATIRQIVESSVDFAEIQEQLGVSHILMGNIRGDDDNLRISAWLIDATSGREVWAERFDRRGTDMLALQDELAQRVVQEMGATLQREHAGRSSHWAKIDPEALSLYRQAMDLANPAGDSARNMLALEGFERVIEMAPEFAGGYAGAAYMHAFAVLFGHSQNSQQNVAEVLNLAEQAIQIAPDYGMAYTALAFTYLSQREFDKALMYSALAIEAQPNDPYVLIYHGILLSFDGKAESGIAYARRALRLDPLNTRAPYLNIMGTILLHAGRYAEAHEAFQRNIARTGPDTPGTRISSATALYYLNRREDAWRMLDEIKNFPEEAAAAMDWTRRTRRLESDIEFLLLPLQEYLDRTSSDPS